MSALGGRSPPLQVHLFRNRGPQAAKFSGVGAHSRATQASGSIKVSNAWAIYGHQPWSQKRFVQCDVR